VDEYDLDAIFEGADWFHISGITPALSEELFVLSKIALKTAKEKGITTSCDLNYRSSLWTFERAREKMTELLRYVDVCLGVEPLQLLDENGDDMKDAYTKPVKVEDYQEIMTEMHRQFGFQHIAMTFREHLSVNHNKLFALLSDGNRFYRSDEVDVEFVDRVGAGDAFSAGMIYSLVSGYQPQDVIEFATGCFALKHTIEGDANVLKIGDIEQFLVQRGSLTINR
jgi:2-dehydro-3-deoxygluconokinase